MDGPSPPAGRCRWRRGRTSRRPAAPLLWRDPGVHPRREAGKGTKEVLVRRQEPLREQTHQDAFADAVHYSRGYEAHVRFRFTAPTMHSSCSPSEEGRRAVSWLMSEIRFSNVQTVAVARAGPPPRLLSVETTESANRWKRMRSKGE